MKDEHILICFIFLKNKNLNQEDKLEGVHHSSFIVHH